MTETHTHTPLPWTFGAGVEDNEGEFYVCHAGTVCTETTVCNPRSEADARFIVHAVNSHHDLIEVIGIMENALKQIAESHWERFGMDQTDIEEVPSLSGVEAMNAARTALMDATEYPRAILTKAEARHG